MSEADYRKLHLRVHRNLSSELARDLEKRGFLSSETFRAEVEPILAAALAGCAREAGEIKIGHLLRIIAELRTSAKDFDSMGYGLFAVKMQRLAAELEDLTGRERAVGEKGKS